ncbi:DDE-type integrase/transposase/recombinase [Falsihalocynthiibacter sp. SS001]|uniref:DDE-type integrase/transposase/recombinase n=1 Tax=Falsihalocynthiibacter sp. SS001 TaxID=3349698 RepID=UPI0036D3F546
MRGYSKWQWQMDEVLVKISNEWHYLWRAVDHEGEGLISYVKKRRNRKVALKILKKTMTRHGKAAVLVTDRLRHYGAAMKMIGDAAKQETGRWKNYRSKNSHLRFQRRE